MLSVVIPVADVTHLAPQLHALGVQHLRAGPPIEWELVLVDDGGGPAVQRFLREANVPESTATKVVSGPQRGSYAARNVGAGAAAGDRLLFCDADDVVSPTWLAGMVRALGNGAVATGPLDLISLNRPVDLIGRDHAAWVAEPRIGNGFLPYALGCNLGVRRSVFDELGGFRDRRNGGDKMLSWDAQLAGHELVFDVDAAVAYRLRSSSADVARRHYRIGRAAPSLYRRYRPYGMARDDARAVARDGVAVLRGLTPFSETAARRVAVAVAAKRIGRLAGSVRDRQWYP